MVIIIRIAAIMPHRFSPILASAIHPYEAPHAMAIASELVLIAPSLCLWQAYDPTVKADLFSTAILTAAGTVLVDPIQMENAPLRELLNIGSIAGIFITSANHWRAAAQFVEKFSIPIFAHPGSISNEMRLNFTKVADGETICEDLHVIAIEGAASGETALYHSADGGTLVVGDALINFEPYGFAFLPGKYCSDEKEMQRSLRKLLQFKAARMFFAHGLPILSGADDRLERLLDIAS